MTVPASRRRPEGRYDEPSLIGQRVLAVILAVLVVLLAVVGARFAYERLGGEQVRGSSAGYDVVSDREVRIDVEVRKPQGRTAYCLIRARGADGAEVGRDVAAVDPVGTGQTRAQGIFDLATSERAVTGEVSTCRVEPITREEITR